MTVISAITDADSITTVVMDFTDEVLPGTPEAKSRTTAKVSGDYHVYLQSLAEDFRNNNRALFPVPEIVMPDPDEMMRMQEEQG